MVFKDGKKQQKQARDPIGVTAICDFWRFLKAVLIFCEYYFLFDL